MTTLNPKRAQRGIAVLLTSVMIVGAMTIVGLAVDVGMMYAIKVKLSAAADAAALAGARAIGPAANGGPSVSTVSQAYFTANMPSGYMLSTNSSLSSPGPVTNPDGSQTVATSATATFPLMFMRFLNNSTVINVGASASRRALNLVMVLDRSGSMASSGSCAPMVAAAQDFVNNFVPGQDGLGLVVFGGSYDNTYGITKNFTSGPTTLSAKLGTITCSGNTGSSQAITIAHQMLSALPVAQTTGAINAIVFFTDGQPNGITADWPISTATTPVYANSSGAAGGSVGTTSTQPWYLGYAKSGCTGTVLKAGIPTITGFIARNGENQHGIRNPISAGIGNDGAVLTNAGCNFTNGTADSQGNTGENRVHQDVAYIPDTDHYGNRTTGYWDTYAAATKQFINAGPYSGKVMLDFYQPGTCPAPPPAASNPCGLFNNNIDLASMNAAESAANSARIDALVPVVIFSIGLGGAQDTFPQPFLEHVANTTTADTYVSTQPSGQFIYVTGAGQLGGAFQQIASYLLRLSS